MKNISKFVKFFILISLCSSCMINNFSYEKKASRVIADIQDWRTGPIVDYKIAMNKHIDDDGNVVKRDEGGVDALTLYLFAGELSYLTGSKNYGLISYLDKNVAPITRQITYDGFELLSDWEALDPPDEMRTAHTQIKDCLEYEINKYKKIEQSFSTLTLPELPEYDPCVFLDNAIERIISD